MKLFETSARSADHFYCFQIALNPPMVDTMKLSENIMAGFIAYPNKLEIIFGNKGLIEILIALKAFLSTTGFIFRFFKI